MPSWNKVGARKSTSETPSDLSESRVLANLAKLALGDLTDTPVPIPPISADAWSVRHPTFLSPTTAQSLLGTHAESSNTGAPNTVPADSTVTLPFNRMGFSISASSHGDLYFFGGATDWNKRFHNDLYRYSTTENTFSSLQCQGDVPSPRSGHVTATMGKVLLLHGGMTSASNRDDGFFMLNLALSRVRYRGHCYLDSLEWTKIVPAGKAPQARVYHAAAVVGTTFYIFGGSFGNIRYTSANCLWSFDLSTLFTQPTWEIVQPSTPEHPVKRLRHFMVPFYDQLIMFGGQEDLYKYSTLKDTWSFHLKTRVWSKIQSTPDISITSGDQAAASVGSFVYVFGGNCRDLRSNYISAFNMHGKFVFLAEQ
ncbi:Tip elongation aberrant protein 1 [Leucoagaricus sp. SymC.cos]|nr:Tip elongation aberrant protein 1 [Leucoagaricus sp. SymC.cos]